jgi:hypothetical protein
MTKFHTLLYGFTDANANFPDVEKLRNLMGALYAPTEEQFSVRVRELQLSRTDLNAVRMCLYELHHQISHADRQRQLGAISSFLVCGALFSLHMLFLNNRESC